MYGFAGPSGSPGVNVSDGFGGFGGQLGTIAGGNGGTTGGGGGAAAGPAIFVNEGTVTLVGYSYTGMTATGGMGGGDGGNGQADATPVFSLNGTVN